MRFRTASSDSSELMASWVSSRARRRSASRDAFTGLIVAHGKDPGISAGWIGSGADSVGAGWIDAGGRGRSTAQQSSRLRRDDELLARRHDLDAEVAERTSEVDDACADVVRVFAD